MERFLELPQNTINTLKESFGTRTNLINWNDANAFYAMLDKGKCDLPPVLPNSNEDKPGLENSTDPQLPDKTEDSGSGSEQEMTMPFKGEKELSKNIMKNRLVENGLNNLNLYNMVDLLKTIPREEYVKFLASFSPDVLASFQNFLSGNNGEG